ncbi:organic hydroperoxide resistance protein [Angustibacter peucedani]
MTTTPEKILYTARATAKGGRRGHAATDDGEVDVQLTAPVELGGPGTGTNPEQLFAVGYAACFNGALALVAKAAGVDASESRVRANVGFGPEGGGYVITVDLEAEVPGVDLVTAQQLVDKAHEVCPYSRATAGNVPVSVTAVESLG